MNTSYHYFTHTLLSIPLTQLKAILTSKLCETLESRDTPKLKPYQKPISPESPIIGRPFSLYIKELMYVYM